MLMSTMVYFSECFGVNNIKRIDNTGLELGHECIYLMFGATFMRNIKQMKTDTAFNIRQKHKYHE